LRSIACEPEQNFSHLALLYLQSAPIPRKGERPSINLGDDTNFFAQFGCAPLSSIIRRGVLHPLHESAGDDNQTADCDLLAVRFPHVYEEIGGQSGDWDSRFSTWGFSLDEDIIGLIVEVKTSPNYESKMSAYLQPEKARLSRLI
jgi:hypothetical protein